MKKANQEYQNNKTINNHLSKKLLASSGFLTGAIVSLSPYLAKVITPKTIYVQNFVADNVSPNSGDFSFKLQGKTKQDTDWAKKADLELVYISQKSRYSVKTKVEYDPKTDTFHTYADNLLGGSIYELQLVAPNNPRYYFSFSKTSQFFSTKNQVEKFSHYDIENDTILDLDLFDSQNLLDSANLILYYKEVGSNKILEAKGQLVAKNDQKQASFVLRNLDRNQKYEIVGTKYYFDDPDQLFDLAISPLANRYFAPSPISGKILNLSQKAYGLNSALLEISLAFENKNIKINPNEKINLEYYYKDELDNFQFGVANDVSLVVQNNKVFANLDLKQIPGGTKFWISRIWNNSGSLAISTNNNLSFISAPEIARIRTFVDANNTSSFDIKFNDQSLMLNGKEVKINFFADDQPTKMLSSSAQVVGNKLFSLAKNLPKEKHFTISSLEIVENATNFDENGQPQTSQIFFAQNFDQKQKKFFTNATSAMVESVVVDRISEDQSRVSMILDSVDDFIKDKIATLYFKVAGSSNLIKSQAQAFSINGNKLVLSWDLINLEPGTNYLIDSVGIADSTNEFVNKLFLNFGPNISTNKLTWTTRPAVSSITYTTKSDTAVELNIAFKNILESLKKAKITYKELIPGGTSKTIDAIIENNSIIANLEINSLSKGQNYLIEKIEVEDYKSSKGDSDILSVSKTITPAQKIFGVHAPLVLTKIENLDEQQTSAKLKVTFSPETIKAIGNDKVKIYYSLAGSSKLLSAFADQTNTGQNTDNSLTFELSDLEIGSKYNINSIVLTKEVELNQDTNKVLTERNILFGDADHKFDSSQSSFFTQSAIIEVGYDNSYEQRVIATFILADAKGVYNGKTATLKYRLKAKNGDENLATTANFKEGKISAKVNSARILFDITDLYKQGLYEIDKNSLELEGTTTSPATASVQTGARVRRSVTQFTDTNTTAVLIPFKDKLLDSTDKRQFETIPKTANVTKIQLTNRTKNTATFEVEFGKDFPNQANAQATATEKLDDFLNKNKLKVRFKKYGGEQQEQIVEAKTEVGSQKTTFELTGLENGQQYVILGFEQVQDDASPSTPKVDIYLDDLDFYKDQIIATAAVIKKIEFDTEVETQARLRLELKDDGRYTAGKKLIVELEKIDTAGGTQAQGQANNLILSGTSLNGIYDFTFLNLEKATKYKIKSVKFEKEATPAANSGVATFASRRTKRSLDPVLVNVDSQTAAIQEEEIDLLETDTSLEDKKSFVTTAKTAKIVKIETESIQTTSLNVKLTLDNVDDYLGQKQIELSYRNLSTQTSQTQQVEATVDQSAKTITFNLSNLSPGDKYEIENIKLKEDSTQVRNDLDLKKQEFKFEFDNSPNTQAGFEKQFFSPRPSLAQIKPISTSETSVQINIKLNDNGANWNNKFLQIKIKSKSGQPVQSQIPTVYSAEIINGNAVFDISGLEKAGQYEIEELKVLDSLPAQPQPNQIQGGEKVDGFDSTATGTDQPGTQPDQKVTKEFVLDAESATITDISYKSDNTSADIRVSFAQNEQFLYQSSANTKRKLQFTFQDSQTGQQVTTQKEFESNQGQGTKPTIDLSLDSVSPGNLYVLTKVEDITPEVEGGPKRLKTFKFSDPQQAQGTQQTTTPEVLSKLYFATKPEVIAYSIDKISETKYLANFTIKDPLAGRNITNGGFEGRDVEITLQKMVEPDGTDLQNQTVYNVQQKAKIKNSKFSFELDNLEKNAIYKVLSLTWADIKQTTSATVPATTLFEADPTTKTTPTTNQQFSDFAIKVSDPGTDSKIEGNVAGNGQIQFGDEFTIRPESAKVVKIEIDDKKVDSATITLTFDNSDQYLKHINYQDKLELIYYQTGSTVEKTARLTLDTATTNEVKFKAELTDLEKGTGFRVLGIKQASSGGSTRRRRSTTSSPNLNFVFDTSLTEDTKKFATLPIVNSILQFRNDANPENYDFILNLKDTGDVFKHIQAGQKSIKAKIQFKKVADGNEAKDTIEEVQAELTRANQITSGVNDAKKSDDQPIQDSTTFKFTLSGLDPFAQYYITKIAYDTTGDTDTALNTKTENNGDKNSGLFNFSPQAEEKRAFLTYPAKVDVKSIDIEPDFNQNNAKLTIKFDPKFKAFLETHQKIKVNYTSPKGLGQSVEIDKNNFNSVVNTSNPEPTVEVTINNINEPGKYVVESLDFLDEALKSSPLLSGLEVPPIAIKESVTIAKRSFYTNTKIIAIRKKAISETSATIELVIEDPNGSFIGKAVKGTFTYNTNQTRKEEGTIIADEIEKTSKVVFQLKNLDKNTDYSITSLVFDQAQNQTQADLGGAQTQFQNQQTIEFDDQKIQENAQQGSGQSTARQEKQFKTTFESATALGITYQLDNKRNGKPWQKAKVRVFFASQDKPLEEKSTRLKLVYKSSKQGISNTTTTSVQAKLVPTQGNTNQGWLNNQPDRAHYYYEFDLDNLDAGAQYTIIGLEDEAQQIKIIVPDPNAPVAVNFSSQPSVQSSFSFNTAPLITKMTYVPSETSIKLNLAVENSQKLDFSNHRAIIKFKKLRRKNIAYGWWDPASNPNDPSTNKNIDSVTVRVPQRQPSPAIQAQQDSEENFGITFLEFELGGLEKGNWYLIEEISLAARGQATTPLSLYIDKEKLQPEDKKTATSEAEKWQTIVNTTVETTTIRSVTSSTTNRSNIRVNGQQKNQPELTSGYFQIELDRGDLIFLQGKYNIQLELESVERKIFYTESTEIQGSGSDGSGGGGRTPQNTQIVLEAKGLIPGDKYKIKNYIFNLKEGAQDRFGVRLPQELKVTPPANNSTIDLKTKNAIKAIKYEAVSEGKTNVDVEFYNNNGELNNQNLTLEAKIDEEFGNKYTPSTWRDNDKTVTSSTRLTPQDGQITSTLQFQINSNLKKAKQYIIKSIKKAGTPIVFDTPISQESALQRKFYSIAEKTKLINTTISEVTTDSATIKLEFDKDDAFLKDDLVTLYLEKGDQSQSIGATTTITNSSSGGQDKLEATFKFLNILEPGRKYKINALTSKTVDLKVDEASKVQDPNLTQGWKFVPASSGSSASSSSSTSGSTNNQVILDFITQPLITNIVKTQINDNDATIELEGWTKDIQDAGFSPKFTVTEKNPTQQQPSQHAGAGATNNNTKEGHKETTNPPADNKITFKVSSLDQFTEYNNITLKLQASSSGVGGVSGGSTTTQNQLSQDLTVAFAPEIASGAKKDLREFRTTAKKLNLADSGAVTLKPISTTTVNLSVKLKNQKQADSIADVPFSVLYKKVFPNYEGENFGIQDISSNPVLINPQTQTLTFNISNLEPGAIYEVTQIAPTDQVNKRDDHKIESLSYTGDQLLQYLKTVQGLPVKQYSGSGSGTKTDKIFFAPLNVPVSLESAWSHPLRYDYYEGEQIYVRFNKEAGTAINEKWLKENIKVKLIPNRTHSGGNQRNQDPVEKELSSVGTYNEKAIRNFGGDVTLSNLEWDPLKTTATFRLQPKSLKSIVGAQIQITIKDINKYHLDPSQDSNTNNNSGQGPESQSITFRLQSSAAIVTPTNVDYMNPGLMGFSYAIYDPLDLIQKTGKDYNPFGEFPHLTPYDEQDWLKVVINKRPNNLNFSRTLSVPNANIFNNRDWSQTPLRELDVPEPPVAIRTKTDVGLGIKYLTLYWRVKTNLGTFQLPERFRNAKPLWYPAGEAVHLPISLQFKTDSISSLSSTYSFVLNSPYGLTGHVMPYTTTATPHDAKSIVNQGRNYWQRWNQRWGQQFDSDNLIPRINKFPKNISKVFWSAPSFEWTTNDSVLNDVFFLNRALPRLQNNNSFWIQTGIGDVGGTNYNGSNWNILYIKNKEGSDNFPQLSRATLNWNHWWQRWESSGFENQSHKSSWIISITNQDTGHPLLYDPINYYDMLGPFRPPELPE
ncbi:hypothetical protein R7X40_02415 [Mesomycoplasma ovipneumoniae]|uniref:DUF1410 domain-containing protein n=2 Tax=Mesomycoplasma ovipneumoniae TaxID=29562 RepID=UPI002964F02E|nr:DUF1410 domain-containing protein [Mesomycoplasma ovipneumoniae]MDW2922930.1 hypothetical protein [Mesomycoplasma ovipneumoniae]